MLKPFYLIALGVLLPLSVSASAEISQNPDTGYEIRSSVTLVADGPEGKDTYKIIRKALGSKAIEAPDLYGNKNHRDEPHITEDIDDEVGAHFVFKIHRDQDWDRDKYPKTTDRQRNEIKSYKESSHKVIGRKGETMSFQWKFKMAEGMEVSKKFTHLFQLKPVDGLDSQPLSTITARETGGKDVIEIRYAAVDKSEVVARYDNLQAVQGVWLTAYCRATFGDNGSLYYSVTKPDGTEILHLDMQNVQMWRSGNTLMRPKWGIYRSLLDKSNLRADEEVVRFANFMINKLKPLQ